MANFAAGEQQGVASQHETYAKRSRQWKKTRDAIAGEDAIHEAGSDYLPKLKDEGAEAYKARKGRTGFYNATGRTHSALVGMLFRKEPNVEVPDSIKEHLEDVTQTGRPLPMFAEDVSAEVIGVGKVGILVDYPPKPVTPDGKDVELTVADAEASGMRPRMSMYKAEAITNWQHRLINNKWTLSQVRLFEQFAEDDPSDEFKQKTGHQYRVLDLIPGLNVYRQRIFRKDRVRGLWEQHGEAITPLMHGKPMSYIPFEIIEIDDGKPPMLDLVAVNIKHYQVTADYEHGCHFTGLPTPYICGQGTEVNPKTGQVIKKEMYIGSMSAWTFPNTETKVGYLEFTGTGLSELRENLTAKEAKMAALGARMLAPEKSGVEASETLSIRNSGEQSVLSKISVLCSLSISKALKWFTDWASTAEVKQEDVKCELNRDFIPVAIDAATLTALMGAWQAGGLSEPELFELLKRGDVIRADKTLEDHQGEVESNPTMTLETARAGVENTDKQTEKLDEPEEKPAK